MRHDGRALECACPLLVDHDVGVEDRKRMIDRIAVRIRGSPRALGRDGPGRPRVRPDVLGAEENRNPRAAARLRSAAGSVRWPDAHGCRSCLEIWGRGRSGSAGRHRRPDCRDRSPAVRREVRPRSPAHRERKSGYRSSGITSLQQWSSNCSINAMSVARAAARCALSAKGKCYAVSERRRCRNPL